MLDDSFRPRLDPRWRVMQVGGGRAALTEAGLRLGVAGARRTHYANAQIDDYLGLSRDRFPWRPPLRMTVRARFSGPPLGTAGFGFWNSPLSPAGQVLPVLPAAIWFFYAAPPADMPLALGVPGHGWKASCVESRTLGALAWAPLAPAVLLLNNIPGVYHRLWPRVQRALRVAESALEPPSPVWRTYTLEWRTDGARFTVDGATVLETDRVPRGPLGFVAWVDSQWLIATPRGRFGWGLHEVSGAQWMDLARVQIEPL
ncbi:MAG: hypothetical protein RLZZ387_2892 [Chloroflexota bacterium]|jgi:hypothetical protein